MKLTRKLTWYDSRANDPNRSPEYRLYYKDSIVIESAKTEDLLIIAKKKDDTLLIIITNNESTIENQMKFLFGIGPDDMTTNQSSFSKGKEMADLRLDLLRDQILELIGIESIDSDDQHLDQMLETFEGTFPSTIVFSSFARETLSDISALDDPDDAILQWQTRETKLFKILERHLVKEKLREGFGDNNEDVDAFVTYSLSVHNRRKARAGQGLENHLTEVFDAHQLSFSSPGKTEGNKKPDFLFPDNMKYANPDYAAESLLMLGAKTSCKDRWRQVLAEAQRIPRKHLFTLEAAITKNQTAEMQGEDLQLVVPKEIHETYTTVQQQWLMNLSEFINHVKQVQKQS